MTTIETYVYDNCIRERNNYFQNYEDTLEENMKLKAEIGRLKEEYKKLYEKYNELLSRHYGAEHIYEE